MSFLCFRRILVRSATFDSHPAARGRSWIPLGNWSLGPWVLRGPGGPLKKHLSSRLEACCVWWTVFNLPISAYSLSPLFTPGLNFFWGGPLRTPGPLDTCPGYPPPLSRLANMMEWSRYCARILVGLTNDNRQTERMRKQCLCLLVWRVRKKRELRTECVNFKETSACLISVLDQHIFQPLLFSLRPITDCTVLQAPC